jgi:hypothetical protein
MNLVYHKKMCKLDHIYINDIERFQRSIMLNNVQKIAFTLRVASYFLDRRCFYGECFL